jgi:glycosyltransferase involved in cell wall biosynthesis
MAEWHVVTGEYPPQRGGVSDYTFQVVGGLAAAGDAVHVWCPPAEGVPPELPGVMVHREMGRFAPADLARAGRMLDRFPAPRRLLVQWVPHSYGYRSLNLALCLWLLGRARRSGDEVQVMVHEPHLSFRTGAWRRNAASVVHRLMAAILLQAARRVWVAAPLWAEWWRPLALRREVPFAWLPISSNVPEGEPQAAAAVRARYAPAGGALLGHFGTYGEPIARVLRPLLPRLLEEDERRAFLLLGRGGAAFREELLGAHPGLEGRVHAPGELPGEELSAHLRACDLLVQPYPGGGVNGRRTTLLAALQHGVPVVTSSGALTEPLWSESGALALAASEGPEALHARAEELLADPARRSRVGAAARDLYRSRFELSHAIAALRAG